MITIQGFAKLCGCSTQTLRYYDRIGLLTPARVDEWTGYRYYEEEQAMQFVKIKNLQQADFSIEEIRPLLKQDGERLQEAFARKIAEQEQKLERIREIQRSYLEEKMEMQKILGILADFMEGKANDPQLREEFGLDAPQAAEVDAKVHEILADWMAQIRTAGEEIARQMGDQGLEAVKTVMEALSKGDQGDKELMVSVTEQGGEGGEEIPADAERVFERSGWEHVSEWIGNLPEMDGDRQNIFQFRVREDSPVGNPGFSIMMLAVMASRYDVLQGGISCRVGRSEDGANHELLLRK